jgi:flagellar hook assembly protein FlgD
VDVAGLLPADARSLRDAALDPGETYTYRLSVVESDGAQTILADTEVELPALAMSLGQNVPNPFNPSTRIPFTVDRSAHVTLTIYTVAGEHVVTLVDESRPAGRGWADWNGTDAAGHTVASGVYYYQLRVDGRQRVRKMVMLR